jgi:hypothetical protein
LLYRLSPFISLDPVTTAIWLASSGAIILSIPRQTMAYVSSGHNNLDSLWLKFVYSLYSFPKHY